MEQDLAKLRRDVDKLINLVYPIGAIYISTVSTNPSSIIGGTWEQIEDKFLLAAGGSHAAGSSGGEETHVLSVNEMPVHKHDISINAVGDHQHDAYYKGDMAGGGSGGRVYPNPADGTWGGAVRPAGAHTHSVNESNKGSGSAHNNMPPFLAVYVWKRTA